ncbi:uncharacterized protein [Miscanthus floridulus]|uniref:uncharacterized protein n=1 Tax=Miscanthus floridulus TaxID=154761 RepID=UPI00345AD44F
MGGVGAGGPQGTVGGEAGSYSFSSPSSSSSSPPPRFLPLLHPPALAGRHGRAGHARPHMGAGASVGARCGGGPALAGGGAGMAGSGGAWGWLGAAAWGRAAVRGVGGNPVAGRDIV